MVTLGLTTEITTKNDEARAQALANRWSHIHNEEEQRQFRRQADVEDDRDCDDPFICGDCDGKGTDPLRRFRRYPMLTYIVGLSDIDALTTGQFDGFNLLLSWDSIEQRFVHIIAPWACQTCNGEGRDLKAEAEWKKAQLVAEQERQIEVEFIEERLHRMGARMMRPYEHHNEDERYMQYMEEGRFGH